MSADNRNLGAGRLEQSDEGLALAEARRSEQRLRVLAKATQALSEGDHSPEHLLEVLVRELAQTPDSACAVLLLTEDGAHFTVPYAHAPDPAVLVEFRARLPAGERHRVETHPGLKHVTETLTPLFLPRVLRAPLASGSGDTRGVSELLPAVGVTSLLMVPLIVRGRLTGALGLVRIGDEAPPLDEQDLSLVISLAEHTALALTAAELLQRSERALAEREKMAARLRFLAETSRKFAEATVDYERLLAVVARRLAEVVGDLCSVRAVTEDGEMFEDGAVHHADPNIVTWVSELIRQPQRVDQGISGRVVMSGQPLLTPKLTPADWAATLPHYRQILERLRVGSTMLVPLRCRGQTVGVASLARSGTDNPYTEDDLHLVQSIADHAALAISNARSYRAERVARAAALKANETIRQSEIGHRLLFESSPVPVLAFSVDSLDILAANRAALRLYGYTQDELLTMKLWDLRVDADEPAARTTVASGGDGELIGVVRHRRRDGSLLFVEYQSHPLTFLGHRARLAVMTDITGRHEAEQMRSLLSAIVRSSNDAVVSKDLSGTITSWNDAAERLFGYSSLDALGKSIEILIPNDLRAEEASLLATIAGGTPVNNYETVRRRKDGDSVHVSLSLSPILDGTGKVVGASKTARDLRPQLAAAAALRRTEDQLRQAQKMDAVGRLAGGIAHDFNNALSVILGCSGLILADLSANDPTREDVDEIRLAATRAADLTRQLLMFSRQQVVAPRVVDLNYVLVDMDKMLRRIIGEDIDLVSSPAAGLGRILADPSHLDQVVMNLVVNARDAMPKGGQLTIETANVDLDAEYGREHLGAKPGPYVMLAVTDTGHGMDDATRARIFEPFFTTKETGKGTGLGLSTVFGIVQQAGGSVWVYSELGTGTTFKLYFPRVESEADSLEPATSARVLRGTETVLLVEDQDNVRAIARAILKRAGYEVLVAHAAGDALVLCEQHQGKIDLLLTDVVMPQLSGIELAKRIAQTRPETKVLYMSGYTDDSVVRHGVLGGDMAFLQKPFTPESLAGRVRDVLDGAETGQRA
jgi:two-component system, cell cycle sensor histidine kinase and response regulator CckA